MKTQRLRLVASCAAVLAVFLAAAGGHAANPPDLTSSLEFVCAPNVERWPSSEVARHVPDLCLYQGRIYQSGGDWENNGGPCPIFAIEPYTGNWEQEWIAGADATYDFHEFSDGRLYLSAVDIRERDWNNGQTEAESHEGSHFRREADGNWRAYETACTKGNISNWFGFEYQGYRTHNWDMAEYKGYTFICGYGISGSTNWCETEMFNATPSLTSIFRSGMILRRFYSFLVFDDDIFCFARQSSGGSDFASKPWEEWRWDETQNPKQFVKQDAPWSDVAPGVTKGMIDYFGLGSNYDLGDEGSTWFWHPTKFGSRVLYILGAERYNIVPIAAFSAVNQNHHVKAVKIDLGGDDVRPYDIFAADDAVYIVAAKGTSTSTTVENSVWKSTDGVNFTKLFTFTATRPASSLCYADGIFYFGMGANKYTKNAWASLGEDISGRIYRVRVPQAPIAVTASEVSVAVGEGQTGTVSFSLASVPSTNVTLKVWGAGCDAFWRFDRKTLSFTPQNWNVPQSVAFSVEDFGAGDYTAAVVCGTGGTDFSSAYTAVSVAGRAFTPPSDPGAVTLYDTMTISGTVGTAGSGVRVLTDYVPKWNTIVRTKYADDPAASTPQFLFCTREAWNSRMFGWMPAYNNKKQCWWNYNTSQIQSWDNVASTDEVFLEVKNGDAVLTRLWDESHWYLTNTVPVQAFDPMYRMALFQSYTISGGNYGSWGNSFRGDFHYLQIFEWEDGHEVLKHHFVPCTSNGVVKVCDIADGNRIYDITATSGGAAAIGANAQAIGLILPDDSLIPDNPVAYGQLDMSAFSKKMTVTFAGAQSGTTLTDFPVLVKLSTAINGFSYSDFQLSNGGDLRFADASSEPAPPEIDTWNPSGVSTVWVKVPSLTKDTAITACWGCAEPPEVAAKDVWDAGYVGVWHLGEDALPMKESSGTSSDFATKSGTVVYDAEGAVGGAVDFSQATTKNYLMAADDDDLDGFADFTVEVWTRQDAFRTDGNYAGMLSKRNSFYNQESYFFYQNNTSGNTKPVFAFNTNSTSSARASVWAGVLPETGRWTHNAFTRNSGTGGVALYLNGTSRGTGTSGKDNVFAGSAPLYIGCDPAQQSFPGRIDEVRISKVARSAAWVKATHDTIADDAFATYAVEGAGPVEPDRILYVTVASGETDTLDAALVTSYITNIVKRGAGTLVASAIPNYTGTITVNGGVWRGGASAGDFGSEGTVIDVEDGASLELVGASGACPVANALSGKTINLYGAKCASASGKIQIFGNGSATIAFGENVSINLKDADSLIYVNNAKWDTCNFKSGAVNLGGKTLTIQATRQIQMGLAFSNGGAVVLKGTALYVEWNGMCPSFSGTGVFQGDSPMNIKKKIDAPGWTLKTSHQLYGNVNAMPTKTEFPGWEGPVEFSWNSVQVANYAGASAGTSNTVFNLKGAVSGSGALRIGPGWVNLHSADNTYRGAVYVNGQAVGSGATILPGGGGIGLWNGAACFPDASSVTFTNTARLAFMDSTECTVGTNVFFDAKAGEVQTVTGGGVDPRPAIGRFTKTGAGLLEFSSPAAVAEGRVLAGTLKVTHKDVEGASLAALTARQPQFAKLEFASGTLFDLSDNIAVKVDDLVGAPTVTNAGIFGVMENWKLSAPGDVLTLKGENVMYNGQPVAGMLAFAEGATFTIADEAAFSNAVVAAGSEGLVVARANWVLGDSTLVNGMVVVLPQPSAGMAHRWEMAVGDGGTTLRLRFASSGGYAAWAVANNISGTPAEKTNGIENGIRYAFDIDPQTSDIGTPVIQVVRDADGNPVVQARSLAEGRDDLSFGVLATENLDDWSGATLVPMKRFETDGFWKPVESENNPSYVFPAKMFFRYTIDVR